MIICRNHSMTQWIFNEGTNKGGSKQVGKSESEKDRNPEPDGFQIKFGMMKRKGVNLEPDGFMRKFWVLNFEF